MSRDLKRRNQRIQEIKKILPPMYYLYLFMMKPGTNLNRGAFCRDWPVLFKNASVIKDNEILGHRRDVRKTAMHDLRFL